MNDKKRKMFLVILIVFLAIIVTGATFAYFQAQTSTGKSVDVKVTVHTVDTFSFSTGSTLKFTANQTTFTESGANATASTTAKAILTANNKTNTATQNYYLYLKISQNNFVYTQDSSKPELLLTVKDPSGIDVTSITGLTYKTVTNGAGTSVSGFDVTTKSGVIALVNNRSITTTSSITEDWTVTLTFVNYSSNQAANGGKTFNAKLMIQKEEYELTFADACADKTLKECIISQYTGKQGENNIYYHDSTLTNGAGDNSYRFAGASESVNNYICLGSDTTTCPDANLFRIIGVFGDQVKVIRAKSVGNQKWNTGNSTTWSKSSLNTYLNGEYLTSLGTLAEKIATTKWKVGGGSITYLKDVPATAYQYEVGSSASITTHDAKIGLMYVSDYAFAADQSGWTTKLSSYKSNKSKDWLFLGYTEWTISRNSNTTASVFYVNGGSGDVENIYVANSYGVRPSFNLESTVAYVSGSGSMSDPIRVN